MTETTKIPTAWLKKLLELERQLGQVTVIGNEAVFKLTQLIGYIESCESFIGKEKI